MWLLQGFVRILMLFGWGAVAAYLCYQALLEYNEQVWEPERQQKIEDQTPKADFSGEFVMFTCGKARQALPCSHPMFSGLNLSSSERNLITFSVCGRTTIREGYPNNTISVFDVNGNCVKHEYTHAPFRLRMFTPFKADDPPFKEDRFGWDFETKRLYSISGSDSSYAHTLFVWAHYVDKATLFASLLVTLGGLTLLSVIGAVAKGGAEVEITIAFVGVLLIGVILLSIMYLGYLGETSAAYDTKKAFHVQRVNQLLADADVQNTPYFAPMKGMLSFYGVDKDWHPFFGLFQLGFGWIVFAVFHIAIIGLGFLVVGLLPNLPVGVVHILVPSKHKEGFSGLDLEAAKAMRDESIEGRSSWMDTIFPFVGWYKVLKTENQSRKHRSVTNVVKARAEELDEEIELIKAEEDLARKRAELEIRKKLRRDHG